MQRFENGICAAGEDIVPADLIAALSGVSLATVGKVIAAQSLIIAHDLATAEEVTKIEAVPTALANGERARNCANALDYFRRIGRTIDPSIKNMLKRNLWS